MALKKVDWIRVTVRGDNILPTNWLAGYRLADTVQAVICCDYSKTLIWPRA